jgi:hypothetical protein
MIEYDSVVEELLCQMPMIWVMTLSLASALDRAEEGHFFVSNYLDILLKNKDNYLLLFLHCSLLSERSKRGFMYGEWRVRP